MKKRTILLVGLLCLSTWSVVKAEESAAPNPNASENETEEVKTPPPPKDTFNAKEHTDWGSYYDPQKIFCGSSDCYKILGFDYENFGKTPPDSKVITKRYRSLSRHWHPDKNKNKGAKDKFVVRQAQFQVDDSS